jgi:hypothetical protein
MGPVCYSFQAVNTMMQILGLDASKRRNLLRVAVSTLLWAGGGVGCGLDEGKGSTAQSDGTGSPSTGGTSGTATVDGGTAEGTVAAMT